MTGRADAPFTLAHENFVYLVERGGEDAIVEEQRAAYRRLTGDARPWDYIEAVYFDGTIDRIQGMVEARRAVGIEYMMLHTLTAELEQLELIARHIVGPFATA